MTLAHEKKYFILLSWKMILRGSGNDPSINLSPYLIYHIVSG
jgi:hypothetical protein